MEPWQQAVEAIGERARRDRGRALERLGEVVGADRVAATLAAAARSGSLARVTLNFHPDRIAASGRSVAAGLADDGRYLSQWVTWISNGGRSALPGGDRHRWERTLFEGAYDGRDPGAIAHPLYGALDLLRDPHGGSPRFGSGFLVLRPEVAERTTFCVGDSHLGPTDVGAGAEPVSIVAGLAEQADRGELLGRELGVEDLLRALGGERVIDGPGRELDASVEAQVHGGLDLAADVEAIVADPSFRDTEVGAELARAAASHPAGPGDQSG